MKTSLLGHKFNIAMNQVPPFIYLTKDKNRLNGFESKIIYILSQILNFTFEAFDCGYHFGHRLQNNTWNGIIGKVSQKIADFGLGGLSLTSDRAEVVEYTQPHTISAVTFTSPKNYKHFNSVSLIAPFDYKIWICFVSSLLLLIYICIVFKKSVGTAHSFWLFVNILFQQSIKMTQKDGILIVVMLWMVTCLLLTSIYGGCLHSYMSLLRDQTNIETIDQLFEAQKSGQVQILATEGSSYYSNIMNSDIGIYREIGKNIKVVKSKIRAFELMSESEEKFAFIGERNTLDYHISVSHIPYYTPPIHKDSNIFLDFMTIVLKKEFEYKHQFNRILLAIKESGHLDVWRKQFFQKRKAFNECLKATDENSFRALNLIQLGNAFIICCVGCFVSCLSFGSELLVKNVYNL